MDAPPVAVIGETTARELFGEESPLGRSVRLTTHLTLSDEPREIIGVVEDARLDGPDRPLPTAVYIPFDQWAGGGFYVSARVAGDPSALLVPLKEAIHAIDPLLPVDRLSTLEQSLDTRYVSPRFYTLLLSSFAAVALLLTAAGVFGVLSTTVERRLREIGVHVALGARRLDVVRWAARLGMTPAAAGIVGGVFGAVTLGRLLRSRVAELEAADPVMLLVASLIVTVITLGTCVLAARRALRVDPVTVLRAE